MLFEYTFLYALIDAFCLLFSLFIFTKTTVDTGTEREVRALRALIVVFCVYLIADAFWALGKYNALGLTPDIVDIVESATLLLMGGVAYCWFLFAEYRMGAPFMKHRRAPAVAAVLLVVVIALYATTPLTGFIFSLGEGKTFTPGPLYDFTSIVFMLYIWFTAIHALVLFSRESTRARRTGYLTLAAFVLPPTVAGVIDIVAHGMPVLALAVFASVLLVFMNSQGARINTDKLTGLNNRRRADEYIEDQVTSLASGETFAVFMIDVDYFKGINDTYGHGEGDHALRVIANGLRHAVGGHHGLAARWGGDEFIIAAYLGTDESPDEVRRAIHENIDAAIARERLGYEISASIGYALAHRGEKVDALVDEADRMLYEEKADHHATLDARKHRPAA